MVLFLGSAHIRSYNPIRSERRRLFLLPTIAILPAIHIRDSKLKLKLQNNYCDETFDVAYVFVSYVSCACHRKSVEFHIHDRNWHVQKHRMHCH